MRIGIDIDGVLTDFERWQLDVGSKFFSKYNKTIVNHNGYSVREVFGVSKDLSSEFWNEHLFEYATDEPARKYASEIIEKLRDENNEIFIITARYLTDKENNEGNKMRNIVTNWLKKQNIFYHKIIFSPEDKLDICLKNNIDLMIEDCVNNINKISESIPVICFHAGYNKNCKGKNIYRAYSWYDISSIIKTIKGNFKH